MNEAFASMTFPCFKPFLASDDPAKLTSYLIVDDQPAALALGVIRPTGDADLLSLYVAPHFRGRGLARHLLKNFETEAATRRAARLVSTYTHDLHSSDRVGRLLQRDGWALSAPRMLICRAGKRLLEAPWMQRSLETGYEVVPWSDITSQERAFLEANRASIPETLYPFPWEQEMYPLEPLNSLALRENGFLRGWLLTHRIDPLTVRYTCAYVDEALQKMALGVTLMAEAIRRQKEVLALESHGIWATPYKYSSMIRFIRRRMEPYLDSLKESIQVSKQLGASIPTQA